MELSAIIIHWKAILEILILWFVIFQVMLFFEGTKAIQVVRGIAVLLVAFFVFQRLGLERLDWLFRNFFAISIMAILIIFHPEIRQGLARLEQRHMFVTTMRQEDLDAMLKEISQATEILAKDRMGALIAIEKKESLSGYVESGVKIDAKISSEILQAIFTPNNPLHDGGVVIQHGRLISAGSLFPLAQRQDINRIFGTRHRAALGLSEDTDAVIIIVSEERGDISLVHQGKLYKDLSHEGMFLKAKELLKLKDED
jgi:diadenylate cyclase